jgi:hypothetical protein
MHRAARTSKLVETWKPSFLEGCLAMKRWFTPGRRWLSFGGGLTAGLLVGVGLLIGGIVGNRYTAQDRQPEGLSLPITKLHATATHGGETFAMATGAITPEVEGVFFLDYLTGELQCQVVSVRYLQLAGVFKHNVIADLGIEKGKKPSFLLTTGQAQFRSTGGAVQFAGTIVYVADANSGNWAAYALPWNRQAESVGVTQAFPMKLIGGGKARDLALRDQ